MRSRGRIKFSRPRPFRERCEKFEYKIWSRRKFVGTTGGPLLIKKIN